MTVQNHEERALLCSCQGSAMSCHLGTQVRIGLGPGEGGSSPIAAPSTVRKGRHLPNWQPLLNSYAGAASVMVPNQAALADLPADWPVSG